MKLIELLRKYETSDGDAFWSSIDEYEHARDHLQSLGIYIDDILDELGEYKPTTYQSLTLPFGKKCFYKIGDLRSDDRETLRDFALMSIGNAWSDCSASSEFPEFASEFLTELFIKVFAERKFSFNKFDQVLESMAFDNAFLAVTNKFLGFFLEPESKSSINHLRSVIHKLKIQRQEPLSFAPSLNSFNRILSQLTNKTMEIDKSQLQDRVYTYYGNLSPAQRILEWHNFLSQFNPGTHYATHLISHQCSVSIDLERESHATIMRIFALIKIIDYQTTKTSFEDVVLAEGLALFMREAQNAKKIKSVIAPIRRKLRRSFL